MLRDQDKVIKHMLAAHNYKVETNLLDNQFLCNLCIYKSRDMAELKTHLILIHQKDNHNWMVENIDTELTCDDCDLVFPGRSMLISHLQTVHIGDRKEVQQNDKGIPINEDIHEHTTKIECHVCEKSCTSTKSINEHMIEMHPSVIHDIIEIEDQDDEIISLEKEETKNCDEPGYVIEVQPKKAEEGKKTRP